MSFAKNANVLACAFKIIEHHCISALFSELSLWKLGAYWMRMEGSFSFKVSSNRSSLLSEAALASLLPPSGLENPHIYVILLQALACAPPDRFTGIYWSLK